MTERQRTEGGGRKGEEEGGAMKRCRSRNNVGGGGRRDRGRGGWMCGSMGFGDLASVRIKGSEGRGTGALGL